MIGPCNESVANWLGGECHIQDFLLHVIDLKPLWRRLLPVYVLNDALYYVHVRVGFRYPMHL